jgi:hypothetical protein
VQHGLQERTCPSYKDSVSAYFKTTQTLRHA